MMRITTNSMLFNYQYNRMNSTNLMNNAMTILLRLRGHLRFTALSMLPRPSMRTTRR